MKIEIAEPIKELYEIIIFDNDLCGTEGVVMLLKECFPDYSDQLCRKIMTEAGGKGNIKHHATCFTGTLEECQKHCDHINKFMTAKVCKVI